MKMFIRGYQKTVFMIAFLLVIVIFMPSLKAEAAEQILPFDQEVSGILTKTESSQIYKINVPKAGRVTFNLTSYVDDTTYIKVYDVDNDEVFDNYITGSSKTPAKLNKWVDLESGSYYVEVYNGSWWATHTGQFLLKTSFTPVNNTDIEPNNGTIEAQSLSFNKTEVGFLSWNDQVDYYKISVPKAGRVYLDLYSYVDDTTYIQLFDSENNRILNDDIKGSSKTPVKYYNWIDLEAGTYFVKILEYDYSYSSGKYNINVTFNAANNNEVEPNNGTVEAQPVTFNTPVTGFLSWNDRVDFYKVTVPRGSRIQFSLNSYVDNESFIKLIDENNEEVFTGYLKGSSKSPAKYTKAIDLSAGTYYVKIYEYDYSYNSGKYILNITAPGLAPLLSLQAVSDQSTVIKGKTSANTVVTTSISNKVYKATSNKNGDFSIKIPKQKAGSIIRVSATNSYGSKVLSITVLDRTPPVLTSVNSVNSKSKTVTGKAEIGSRVYVYNGSKLLGNAAVSNKGTYSIKISPQKKGASLKVIAQDKAKNKSKPKWIKVK